MKPIKFIREGDRVKFIYPLREFLAWYKLGKDEGTVGALLIAYEGKFNRYLCFGTLENPSTTPVTFNVQHLEMWDGPRLTPEQIINPPPFESPFKNARILIIDTENNRLLDEDGNEVKP